MGRVIGFVAYESPFAPGGGIAAVMGRLPGFVQQATTDPVVVITPFHRRITAANHEKQLARSAVTALRSVGTIRVGQTDLDVLRCDGKWPWYHLRAVERHGTGTTPFFNGDRHPYDVPADDLRRDALLFGAAVTRALPLLARDLATTSAAQWVLLLQDWEAATTALAAGSANSECRVFLTLHNSYDSGVSETELARFGMAALTPTPGSSTVLQRALPVVELPVSTVSEQFALDLIEDTFQRKIMAPHLTQALRSRLVGVDNGPFADLAIETPVLDAMFAGNYRALLDWKAAKRHAAIAALERHVESEREPVWGDRKRFKHDDAPWFVMAGRDDPRQKGYDVAASAIARFLTAGGDARFIFFPIPGDEGHAGLGFLRRLAVERADSVLVLPFVWQAGFFAALQGAAYGLMPSLYEPFGMANEFYLKGTVGIARATGGLVQQIVPLRAAAAFSRRVLRWAERWHSLSAPPTGILFREDDDRPTTEEGWRQMNEADYDPTGVRPERDRVRSRERIPLFRSMADELLVAMSDGVEIFKTSPRLYCQMLLNGISHIQQTLSWKRAAQEYLRIVQT